MYGQMVYDRLRWINFFLAVLIVDTKIAEFGHDVQHGVSFCDGIHVYNEIKFYMGVWCQGM